MRNQKNHQLCASAAMMEIFATLTELEKAAAIAYAMGLSGQPLDKLLSSKEAVENIEVTVINKQLNLSDAEIESLHKFRALSPNAKERLRTLLDIEYEQHSKDREILSEK